MADTIEIIPSHEIDRHAWDNCVAQSPNGLIYATTNYLDHITDSWCGIVANNYETVMPIPLRKKFGIQYCYRVPFIQQLGIFSKQDFSKYNDFISILYKLVRYGDYDFNFANTLPIDADIHINFILTLNKSFHELERNFSKDIPLYVSRAKERGLLYKEGTIDEALHLFRHLYQERTPHVSNRQCDDFRRLATLLYQENNCIVRRIAGKEDTTQAIILLVKDQRRLYNIINCIPQQGRESGANYLLFYEVLKEFSGSNLIFDFEGSDIPGVKKFYEKFGVEDQSYSSIHINNLPLPIRWLKR